MNLRQCRSILALFLLVWLSLFSFQDNQVIGRSRAGWKSDDAVSATQGGNRSLGPGESVESEIKGGEVHLFSVSLAPGQYVRLVVQRKGIDLFVNVIAPGGSAAKHENPAGAQSPIFALIKAEVSGTYIVEIHPVRKWLAAGRYQIHREEALSPTASDEKRLLAQQKIVAARQLLESPNSKPAALANYAEAVELWREAGDTFQEANTLHFIAQTYKDLGDFEKAEEYYKRTLERHGDDREARAYTLFDLAEAYYTIKGPLASLSHYEEALAAFKETQNRRGQTLALRQLGLIHMKQFDWEGARKILQEALDIDRSEGDVYEETRVLNALGGVSDNQGQPERAMELYEQAREGFHRLGDSAREGNMYINIGLYHDTWGEWREALTSYNTALDLLAAGEAAGEVDRSFLNSKRASVFYNIGSLYVSLGDYTAGLDYLQKSLDLRAPKDQGATLMWFGYAYVLAGEPQKALEYCDQAIKLQDDAKDPRRAQSYTVMGMAQDALGLHEKAVEYFDKALEIQQNEKTLDLKGQAITLDKRGRALAASGEVVKARRDLETALIHWRTFRDRNGEALTLFQLASIERDSGSFDAALSYVESAIKLIEPLRAEVWDQQIRASYFASKVDYYGLYIDLKMRSRPADDIAYTVAAFEESERERARALLDMISDANVEVEGLSDSVLASLVEKRRLLRRSVLIKSAQLSEALSERSTAKVMALEGDLAKVSAERDRVDAKLRLQFPRYAALTSAEPLSANQIQHQLDDETLLLEYSLGDKRSYVWAVARDSIKGVELKGRKEIEAAAERMVRSLSERNRREKNPSPRQMELHRAQADAEYSAASAELSKMVLQPVATLLGNKRLVIVADGALQLVPFQALPNPNPSGEISANSSNPKKAAATNERSLMIEDHEIVYEASASVLALQRKELESRAPARHELAVFADPVFNQEGFKTEMGRRAAKVREGQAKPNVISTLSSKDLKASSGSDLTRSIDDMEIGVISALPQSRDEAEAIMKLVPKEERMAALGFDASRATAMNPNLSQYRIIHIATHGFANFKHPELSGIVFSLVDEKGQPQDGYLRLHDIYNLNLPADLVVLSACQTGVGKQIRGEGLIALTRGFTYAGAARVVASLWKVDDEATRDLMEEFYKQMFTNKLKPAAALRKAQIKLSRQSQWRSPFYWAGFVLQGEWR